jgi:mannan endo-1,4-beta-mannosidase
MPGDAWNGLQRRIAQCRALGKPLIVGESGITTASVAGLAARAQAFAAKLDAQLTAGVAGVLRWTWVDADNGGSSLGDNYRIGRGDPVLAVLGLPLIGDRQRPVHA